MENNAGNKIGHDTEVNTQSRERGIEFDTPNRERSMEFNTRNGKKNKEKNRSCAWTEVWNSNGTGKNPDLLQKPEIDSDRFFKLISSSIQGLREYRLIVSALELGVFEALKTPLPAADLAERLECDPGLMSHFCEALYKLGLLDRLEEGNIQKQGNKEDELASEGRTEDRYEDHLLSNGAKNYGAVYLVSELSAAYLLESSPFSQRHYLAGRLKNVGLWDRLSEIMKNGPEVFEKGVFFGEVVHAMAENARCGLFQETVRVVTEHVDLGSVKKLLDLGGGHGLYAIAFAKLNENLRAFVFDLPSVTEKTIGDGYDLIFSSFNPGGKVPYLIPRLARALNPGGIFVTRQMPDEKIESSPLLSLDWNLWTFEGVKKGGSGYSFENSVPFTEYIKRLSNYGFEVFRELDMQDGSRIVFAQKMT